MSEDRGREEVREEDCKRPVQISGEEERSRELEQQTRSFLSVMQNLIPGFTTSPRPGCSGAGASLGSSGNMEPSGFSPRGGNRDGLFSLRNFPIPISVGPGVASTSTVVRMPNSNPLSVQSTTDPHGNEEGFFVPGEEVPEEKRPASVSTTTQQSLDRELSGVHDHEAPPSDLEDEDDVEKAMTEQHRELLTLSREELVRDMTPDEIFNVLIAEKIFTSADVSRIKGSNSIREEVNEKLLNYLPRRPDRAFFVFKEALEKTLQSHLSDLLDPNKNSRFKKALKRKQNRLATQNNSPSAKTKCLLSANIASSTSTSTSSSTAFTTSLAVTSASSIEETNPPTEQALELDAMSIPTRSYASHASTATEASEGAKVGSSAGLSHQDCMSLRASLVKLIGSQGFHMTEEQIGPCSGSRPCQVLGQQHPIGVFHGSSYLGVDVVDSSDTEREPGGYGEADSEAGAGIQGMEEVFAAYLELENRFMEMARNAYAQLAPRDGSDEALEQFMVEYVKTNQHLQTTVQLLSKLKEVCRWHPNHNT